MSRKAIIVEQLLDPQGIDWANGAPYIATSDRGSRGTRKLCAEDPRSRFDRAVGMYFDQNGNLMFIDNGSDDDDGMPDARTCLHGNRPDGELNVLYSVAEHVRALEAALPLA